MVVEGLIKNLKAKQQYMLKNLVVSNGFKDKLHKGHHIEHRLPISSLPFSG